MNPSSNPEDVLSKLNLLSAALGEIEDWLDALGPRSPSARMEARALVRTLLARRTVTLQNLDSYLDEERGRNSPPH